MACRIADEEALDIVLRNADDLIAVTDDEVAQAMRVLFSDTPNVAEGAGAAGLAVAMQQADRWRGKTVGVPLTGGNVDSAVFSSVLSPARLDRSERRRGDFGARQRRPE